MRDYGKVHSTFWSSKTVSNLSDDGKLLALYLMTCTHSTIAGVFRLPDGYVAEDIGWSPERVSKGFQELSRNGFATRCGSTKWVWVIKHLDWNPPENPNQRKAAAKVAASVPSECEWKAQFLAECSEALGIEPQIKPAPPAPAVSNPSGTVAEPFRNQEQEQEQKQEQKRRPKARATSLPDGFEISPRVKAWHEERGYPGLQENFEAFVSYAKRKGATYVDWDEALMTAVRENWAKVKAAGAGSELFAGAV